MKPDHDDVPESEQVTRFGCGALVGALLGLALIIGFTLTSLGSATVALVALMIICGVLALVHGDRFWYSLKDWFANW